MPPTFVAILLFTLGLVLLVVGAELLVRGASRLAAAFGIAPLVIGLTIVAFGTSAPELAVSVGAALRGQDGVALGNAVGSNTFNVLFILGLSALIVPLRVAHQLIRIDLPIMIGSAVLLMLLSLDGMLGRIDGVVFLTGIVAYTTMLIVLAKRSPTLPADDEFVKEFGGKPDEPKRRGWLNPLLILVGLAMLVGGSHWLVGGATTLARVVGISERVIGITLVAAGTSLPEVFTSIIAAIKGERDIAIGNVVGSNIFNVFCVLGGAALLAPDGITVPPSVRWVDMSVVLATAVICLPAFITGMTLSRREGAIFLTGYIAYIVYLFIESKGTDAP